jgi:hypothetical protein
MKPFVVSWMMILSGVFANCTSEAQYVTMHGRKFMLNGQEFYPKVLNVPMEYAVPISTTPTIADAGTMYAALWRFYGPGYGAWHFEFHNEAGSHAQVQAYFNRIASMGYNTVRLTGWIIPFIDNDVNDPAGKYTLGVGNGIGGGNIFSTSVELDRMTFSDVWSQRMFHLLREILHMADLAGLKVILMTGDRVVHQDGSSFSPTATSEASSGYASWLERLAGELANEPALMAYDLWNEPIWCNNSYEMVSHSKDEICSFTAQWYDGIHVSDNNHLVTLNGYSISEIGSWDPAVLKIDFYSPHVYPVHFMDQFSVSTHADLARDEVYWLGRTCPIPWMIGEMNFHANDETTGPFFGQDAMYHAWPYMDGTEQEQSDYFATVMDATRSCLGSGISWWACQDLGVTDLNAAIAATDKKNYRNQWDGALRFRRNGSINTQDIMDPYYSKIMDGMVANYDPGTAPTNLPSVPSGYSNWQALTGPVYRSFDVIDQDQTGISDAVVVVHWYYTSTTNDVANNRSFWDRIPTDENGHCDILTPPTIPTFLPPDAKSLSFAASGAASRQFEASNFPAESTIDLDPKRLEFSVTAEGLSVPIGSSDDIKAWSAVTISDVLIDGNGSTGGSALFHARDEVHAMSEFHAKRGSTVHMFTEKVWPDCDNYHHMALFGHSSIEQRSTRREAPIPNRLQLQFNVNDRRITVYPSPCQDQVRITAPEMEGTCTILDHQGRVVFTGPITATGLVVSTEPWASGEYSLQVTNDRRTAYTTFTKLP